MKILQVRFKNLNSLVGEWQIDFTHPAFIADGIFAITGPTGAGKTTILDAICLALYGRTPRLNKVTKSGNEIMSRQTGECFAEVTFASQIGHFRCHWSQNRARKKPTGELQAPKHEIANAETGKILEAKLKGVAEQIEAATGMDFDRFTRSMLLAQGGFAAFLQAAADDRAPILEQITGTEIYSQISIRVHERQRDEQEKLKLLQAETAGLVLLTPEQEQEIEQTLAAKKQQESELRTQLAGTDNAISWLNTLNTLQQELTSLADETAKLQSEVDTFKPEQEKLSRALNAAALDGRYATLTSVRQQQAADQQSSQTQEAALPGLTASVEQQAQLLNHAEQQTRQAKHHKENAASVLHAIRLLDQHISGQKKAVLQEDDACQKDAAKIAADQQTRLKAQAKLEDAQKALVHVACYLNEQAKDAWLIGGLAGVEEQINGLLALQDKMLAQQHACDKAADGVKKTGQLFDGHQTLTDQRQQQQQQAKQQLDEQQAELEQRLGGRLLREYRTEKETLQREMVFRVKIAELEEHRAKLEDGQPCPLCGAKQHPFAQGNVPAVDDIEQQIKKLTELINQAEELESAIKAAEQAESRSIHTLKDAQTELQAALHAKQMAEKTHTDAIENLEQLRLEFAQNQLRVVAQLLPLGITELAEAELPAVLDNLKMRQQTWQEKEQEKSRVEEQLADIGSEITRLDAVIATQATALDDKQQRLASSKQALESDLEARQARYGEQNPDDEERLLNQAIIDAEEREKQARTQHAEWLQKQQSAKDQAASLTQRINQRAPELSNLEREFAAALPAASFASEQQFLAAILPPKQKAALEATAQALNERQIALQTKRQERQGRLASEMARNITDQPPEALELQRHECQIALSALGEDIAALLYQQRENETAKEKINTQQAAIAAQQRECLRWDNLHQLIGSADGKKYRNFAQGLTFDMMIDHANRQLQKMTDRYLLVREQSQPLELNVVDNYQAGEIRSTKNLSGGESFIVSLALALGLSHMASKNVRVDSLFLDEGFGTLDEEALETALETLAGLQQDGKLIGVISHVAALKERISTQINVTPRTGGKSLLAGPGCRSLA